MTGGRGTFSAVHDHYELLPPHLTDKVKQSVAGNGSGHYPRFLQLKRSPGRPFQLQKRDLAL
jgi:hypothetical protein